MGPTLRIVSVNDVYSLENLPRLKSVVRRAAEIDPADALLVTLAGDFVAPSILSSLDAGRGMIDCMNAVGFTHVTFGNHEDDIATDELRARIGELSARWLATNVRGLSPALLAHDVIEVARSGGRRVRIGLVGVVMTDATVYRRKPFGGADLAPANDAAAREGKILVEEERCACVVPLTHQSLADDRALAHAARALAMPIILGGHEHDVHMEQVDGTWIVKSGADAAHAVIVDLTWPDEAPASGAADLPEVKVRLEDVATYAEDPALRARVDAHMRRVHDLEAATLVRLAPGEDLSSVGTRARQTTLGTLLCSRVRDALGADACIFNGGGIRAARAYRGHFTYGDLKAEVPFDNEVVVARLPGRVVRDAIAASRALAPAESGGFLQVDDRMRVSEPDHALVAIDDGHLDLDRIYRIAVVRELFFGLDHIEPLTRFGREHPEDVPPAGSGRGIKLVLVEAFSRALWMELGGFDAVDTNHDGIVTQPEVETAVARFTAEAPSPLIAGLVIHAIDSNHDDVISRDESDAIAPRRRTP